MIGVISDTHGLLRPEALEALRGVEHILHAGDVGDPGILDSLRELAPVTAISGNIDVEGPCSHLPATEVVTLHGRTFYMLHDRHALDLDPAAAGFARGTFGGTFISGGGYFGQGGLMALTDVEVKRTKAKDKAYRMSDSGGMYLWVTPGRRQIVALGLCIRA